MNFTFGAWHGYIYPLGMLLLALPIVVVAGVVYITLRMRTAKKWNTRSMDKP